MSSTNKTTYYELPQFVDNDIFNPLVDDNDAYSKIDTALHNIADAEAGNTSDIVDIKSRLDSAEGDIDALEAQNGDNVLTTTAQTLSGAVNELDADIGALDGRLDIVEDDINNVSTGLKVKVAGLETQNGNEVLDTTSQTLSGAINEIHADICFKKITPSMTTDEIKDIIANNDNIYFEDGVYEYELQSANDAFIIAHSNMNICIDGTLKLLPNEYEIGSIISVDQCENVTIYGKGTLIGDKTTHTGATGEWQHNINITNSENVSVSGITSKNAWGDGIYVGGYLGSKNVYVDKVKCDNNRRNGISIVSAEHLFLSNSKFINTSGTAPQAGIAIETNVDSPYLNDIHVSNCVSKLNTGLSMYATTHVDGVCYFDNCVFETASGLSNGIAFTVLNALAKATFFVNNCVITGDYGCTLTLNDLSKIVMNNNTFSKCVSSLYRVTSQYLYNSYLKNIVENCQIPEGIALAVGAVVKNTIFDTKLVNSTVSAVRRFSQMNEDDCNFHIDAPFTPAVALAQNSELWDYPYMDYNDDSYTAGVTQIDLRYCVLRGMKYIVRNTSQYSLTVLLPANTIKTNSFNGTLASGHILVVERLNSTQLLVTEGAI